MKLSRSEAITIGEIGVKISGRNPGNAGNALVFAAFIQIWTFSYETGLIAN